MTNSVHPGIMVLILTGGGSELHDLRRLEDIARAEKLSVKLDNVTERLGTLTVAGPRSRDLMARITDQVSRYNVNQGETC